MKKKHIGSSLESLFDELGEGSEFRLLTLKKVVADELRERMERAGVSQAKLAAAMKTSRTITHRLLDPTDTGVTLDTLVRASDALGLELDMTFRVKTATPARKVAQRRTG
jgi:antitoxin HicB